MLDDSGLGGERRVIKSDHDPLPSKEEKEKKSTYISLLFGAVGVVELSLGGESLGEIGPLSEVLSIEVEDVDGNLREEGQYVSVWSRKMTSQGPKLTATAIPMNPRIVVGHSSWYLPKGG